MGKLILGAVLVLAVWPVNVLASVTVNGAATHQVMDGFGSSQRLFDDPHVTDTFNPDTGRAAVVIPAAQQNEILDRLYLDLGLTRVRPATVAGRGPGEWGVELYNDNANPGVILPGGALELGGIYEAGFDFSWKRNDGLVDYVSRAKARGVDTYFLSPGKLETWMYDIPESDPASKAEYVEWAMVIMDRWRDRGVELPYYSLINEPSYWFSGYRSGAWLRDVTKMLGKTLEANGYATKIVIPDDNNSTFSAAKAADVLADEEARKYVGALATHLYDEPVSNLSAMKTLSEQYDLPLWMTEFSVYALGTASWPTGAWGWGNLMHELIATYDVSAIDYMFGFFGKRPSETDTQLIGVISSGNDYVGYELTKQYYITGQYSKFVKPGFQRVEASSTDSEVKVTAFTKAQDLVLVLINNASTSKTVQFNLSGLADFTSLEPVRTSATDNWATLPPVPVAGSSFTATLAAQSITTFIGTSGASCGAGDTQSCYTGPGGTAGKGLCRAGTRTCAGGTYGACTGEITPTAELCDGNDNDCDGETDEDWAVGSLCSAGIGTCERAGTNECRGDGVGISCNAVAAAPGSEVCDETLDEDCDGAVDNGCPCNDGETRLCYSGPAGTENVGLCRGGTQSCSGGVWGKCGGDVTPDAELCDGDDNDCDGLADETWPQLGSSCSVGIGACAHTGSWVCGADGSGIECNAVPGAPGTEVCLGSADEDCDGTVDNGCACAGEQPGACYGGASATLGVGTCVAGTQECSANVWGACVGQVLPGTELCDDGLDNDCDGTTDSADPGGCVAGEPEADSGPASNTVTMGCGCADAPSNAAPFGVAVAAFILRALRRRASS